MTDLLSPVGRLVAGSVSKPNTTDFHGNPLTDKAGNPREEFYFAVAIAKGQEQHWSQTDWGQTIYNEGVSNFPGGQAQQPNFAWKIIDGDSNVPNAKGNMPCNKEGYPGHWVMSFSSSFKPSLYNADGTQQITDPNAIKTGYFVQVFGSVVGNNNPQNPGVYLNHSMVALAGYGEEIHSGPDSNAVGFGGALPQGASATPVAGGFAPAGGVPQGGFGGAGDPGAYQNTQAPQQMPQQAPQQMPQQAPQQMPQQAPQQMPQQAPGGQVVAPNNGFNNPQ